MTLMDAQLYDESRDRRRRRLIMISVFAVLILAWVLYHMRNYPERQEVAKFFVALERQDVDRAYALWMQDPNWKQHPEKYSNYTFVDFNRDWGPSGDWGIIKSYQNRPCACAGQQIHSLKPQQNDLAGTSRFLTAEAVRDDSSAHSWAPHELADWSACQEFCCLLQ